jgi:phage terminase large subunit
LIDKAIKTPNCEISVVSESMPHLRRGCRKDFLKIMIQLGRYKDANWNKTESKYYFSNGSYIEFFSVDQPDKLRGARRNVLYVNEANNVSFDAYNQLSIRTSDDIWVDFNPTATFWAHTEIVNEDDSDFIILTYKDNDGLPQTIVDDIEAKKEKGKTSDYWANWWKVYGEGQIGSLEGVCIPHWKSIDKIPEQSRLVGYGIDFGFTNDPTAMVAIYKHNNSYIIDECIYRKGLTNSELASQMKNLNVGRDYVYADSAEPKTITELSRYGFNIYPTKKGKDSIIYGIELINDIDELYVTSSSTNLIKELQSYVWQKDKAGFSINKPQGGNDHAIDALRYGVTMLIGGAKGTYHIY